MKRGEASDRRSPKGHAGFTLVDVMVAMAVAALLVTGVSAATNATVRAAERRKSDAREEELLSRTVELLRDDWRGRVRLLVPDPKPPVGTTVLILSTTSDGVSPDAPRSSRLVTYVASEQGLRRRQGSSEVVLVARPARLEYWDGIAWRAEPSGAQGALRLTVAAGSVSSQ